MYGFELHQNKRNIAKLNLCDNSVFFLIQEGYKNSKEIVKLLDLFSYDLLAGSIAKLHNLQLIEVDLSNGEVCLTEQMLSLISKLNEIAENEKDLDHESVFKVFQQYVKDEEIVRYFKGCIIL
ncbi:MAG: hypothetical protein HFI44_14375 [Lachnospiraceae bacterium]|jgi:hypothetical protein|nr:hypothetical protein [Lachnospiraceae bacterium]NBH28907.1 hypothetical protein [Lachnospiraceae bacterium]